MTRTMIIASGLPKNFWAEAINTACYIIIKKVMLRPITLKTPYELLKGRRPNIPYFLVLDVNVLYIINGKDNLGKFDARSDESIFLGCASSSKAYRAYNKQTMCVEESVHIIFDKTNSLQEQSHDDSFEIGFNPF